MPDLEELTYSIVAFQCHGHTLYRIERSDGLRLIELEWGCLHDPDQPPASGPMTFATRAEAERIIDLCMAGVPLAQIPFPPTPMRTRAWEWATE